MRRQATEGTEPELALRRELWSRGLRYRVQVGGLVPRRKLDIVFPGPHIVVDVRGCFWHGCPEHATAPQHNADWWRRKLEGNVRRDADTVAKLSELGWTTVIVWEHEDPLAAADRIERVVRAEA